MTDPVRLALERIASTSPRLIGPCLPTEHGCCLCLALIDEARDALGWQRWPAVPGTLVADLYETHCHLCGTRSMLWIEGRPLQCMACQEPRRLLAVPSLATEIPRAAAGPSAPRAPCVGSPGCAPTPQPTPPAKTESP